MPAILLSRLNQQALLLAQSYSSPNKFAQELHNLLNYYASHTLKPGIYKRSPIRLTAYNVPFAILKQVQIALQPFTEKDIESVIALCDRLWEEDNLEFRILATLLLGSIPTENTEIIMQHVIDWAGHVGETQLYPYIFGQGLAYLRLHYTTLLTQKIEEWLTMNNIKWQLYGFQAMIPLISQTEFENIPLVYRWLSPFLENPSAGLQNEITNVIRVLARKSPHETSYYLHAYINNKKTASIIRRSLDVFPKEVQFKMRNEMRNL